MKTCDAEKLEGRRTKWDTEARQVLKTRIKDAGLQDKCYVTDVQGEGCVEVNLYDVLRLLGVNFSKRP